MSHTDGPKEKPQLITALENPHYHLLNWYGEPTTSDDNVIKKNLLFWHRWIFNDLSDDQKKWLIQENIFDQNEFSAFTLHEKNTYIWKLEQRLNKEFPEQHFFLRDGRVDLTRTYFNSIFYCKNYLFPNGLTLNGSTFNITPNFKNAKFIKYSNFENTTFKKSANFHNTRFLKGATFSNNEFSDQADFTSATLKSVTFNNVKFNGGACFENTIFQGIIKFTGSTEFIKNAHFNGATFSKNSDTRTVSTFEETIFRCNAGFHNTKFHSKIYFKEVIFEQEVDFTLAEFNCDFHADHVTYKKLPTLSSLDGIIHPFSILNSINNFIDSKTTMTEMRSAKVQTYKNTFAALKSKALEIHQDDFVRNIWAIELKLKRQDILDKDKIPVSDFLEIMASWLYEKTSDFGRSYTRPFGILICLIIIGIIVQFLLQFISYPPYLFDWKEGAVTAIEISISNSLLFLLPWSSDNIKYMNGCVKTLSLFQSIFSFILFFLIGLGLRNKFKIK